MLTQQVIEAKITVLQAAYRKIVEKKIRSISMRNAFVTEPGSCTPPTPELLQQSLDFENNCEMRLVRIRFMIDIFEFVLGKVPTLPAI